MTMTETVPEPAACAKCAELAEDGNMGAFASHASAEAAEAKAAAIAAGEPMSAAIRAERAAWTAHSLNWGR